jgi:phosphoglycolate phosphatase-like HAD superfamily hydrolase
LGQGKLGTFTVALTDFDRTLTRLFDHAALQAACIDLRAFCQRHGVPEESLPEPADPYSVWVEAHQWMRRNLLPSRTRELNRRVARRLARHELRAAGSARLFEGVDRTLRWLRASGLPVLVVSNNSTRALWRALYGNGAADLVERVFGRRHHFEMDELKPSPALIDAALRHVDGVAQQAFFVGDSPTDMLASFAELQSFRFG